MDWQVIAAGLAGVSATLLGVIWHQVSGTVERVAGDLREVAKLVHGHGIRLDMIEGRDNGR